MSQFTFMEKYNGLESKAEFYIVEGEIVEIKIKLVKGRRPCKELLTLLLIDYSG